MSMMCVCAVSGMSSYMVDSFIARIRRIAESVNICIFCPPLYVEPFLKAESHQDDLVFDLADNPVYDNCEHLFTTQDNRQFHQRIDAIARIAHDAVRMGCQFTLYLGESGYVDEAELASITVTDSQLSLALETCFTSIHGFDSTRFVVTPS